MHEVSLCQNLIRIIESESRSKGFARVTAIHLTLGPFTCVDSDAMRWGFGVVSRGTLAEDAALEIEHVPARGWCVTCDREVAIMERYAACPRCGDPFSSVTGADVLRIKQLEVL